jgi:small conductance mechanosensitive channel
VPLDPVALRDTAVDYLLRTLWALLAVIATLVVARAIRGGTARMLGRRRAHPNAVVLLANISQLVVFAVGALVVLAIYTQGAFGWILTSFSVLGLVVGLSLQDILKNFFAGLWILVERPFRIGDTVQIDLHTGVVQEISFRTTHLRTDDGREVIVPNASFMTSSVVNLTRYPARSARIAVTVPAAEAADDVAQRLRDALSGTDAIADDPAPSVVLRGVSGEQAQYEVTLWGRDRERAAGEAIARLRGLGEAWSVQTLT